MFRVDEELKSAVSRLADAGVESSILDAQIMMARVLRCPRLSVISHPERTLSVSEQNAFSSMVARRVLHVPLAYIIGEKEFYGLDIIVSASVLIPRPETEVLIESCMERIQVKHPVIADIGVGSGAIAVALAVNMPDARIYATEISGVAIDIAQANIGKYRLQERITLLLGNLLEPLINLNLHFDAIVSNPPYIPTKDIETLQPEVRLYEPAGALDGGEDGLDIYRRLVPESLPLLKEDGFLAVEVGIGESDSVKNMALSAGYKKVEVIRDLAGIERVVVSNK